MKSMKSKIKWYAGVILFLTMASCNSLPSNGCGSKEKASCSNKCSTNEKSEGMANPSENCEKCGKNSCTKSCSAQPGNATDLKALVPSCSLSNKEMTERKAFLQTTMAEKIVKVEELETGYDLIFHEPIQYSEELLEFINFERECCSNFSFALVFEPNNKATHLQMYGSKEIKEEVKNGFIELGFLQQKN